MATLSRLLIGTVSVARIAALKMEQSCVPARLLFRYAHDWSAREACMNNIIYLVGLVVVVVAVLSFFGLR